MRLWPLVLVAVVVVGCGNPTESEPPTTSRPDVLIAPPPEPNGTEVLPEVPDDPLGLVSSGWELSSRETYDRYQIIDAYLCTEHIDWQAKGLLPIVLEGYRVPGLPGAWIEVAFIDYGGREAATSRLAGLADPIAACADDSIVSTRIESIRPEAAPGFDAYGYIDNDSRSWVVTNDTGFTVLFTAAYIDSHVERSLIERAIGFLQ